MELLSSIQRPNAKGSPESQRKTELSPARKELRRRLAAAHKGESPSTGRKFFRHLEAWMEAADGALGCSAQGESILKRRVEVLAYRFKGDWDALFRSFDACDEMSMDGFRRVVRLRLTVDRTQLSDLAVERLFRKVDTDGSGTISPSELHDYITIEELKRRLRLAAFHADLTSLFQEYDTDGNGELDREEFADAIRRAEQASLVSSGAFNGHISDTDLEQVFAKIDTDKSGTISAKELQQFVAPALPPKLRSSATLANRDQSGASAETDSIVTRATVQPESDVERPRALTVNGEESPLEKLRRLRKAREQQGTYYSSPVSCSTSSP